MALMKCQMIITQALCLFNADGLVDLFMRAGVPVLVQELLNMTQSIFLPYRRFIGSAFLTTPRTLDTDSLATLLEEARYSLSEELTRIPC